MDIKKHISFPREKAPELYDYLKKNGIPFKEGGIICVVDMLASSPHWPFVTECVSRSNLQCQSETIFTEKELADAQWLRVRGKWRNGYPQPEKEFQYESVTYSKENSCEACGCGLMQTEAFRLKQQPKWGKRHFMLLNWVDDEFFVSPAVREVLPEEPFGVEYAQVRNKTGKEVFADVSQMMIPFILPGGMVAEQSPIRNRHVCPGCGSVKYTLTGSGMLTWRRSAFGGAPDIVKTAEVFGSGRFASRLIFVRQNVYQLLKANHLDKDLVFEPVSLM